jgi:hypothetical protein
MQYRSGPPMENHSGVDTLFIVYECLNTRCGALFLGTAIGPKGGTYGLVRVEPITPTKREFTEIIQVISPSFCSIYNEAYYAEQNELTQICGMGYRKALVAQGPGLDDFALCA